MASRRRTRDPPQIDPRILDSLQQLVRQKLSYHQFLIVEGQTGCGKSTTIPHIISQIYKYTGKPVVVTVPRRSAAIDLSKRMKTIMDPSTVGMHIGSVNESDPSHHLIFMTLGILNNILMNRAKSIFKYSAIILDEVHERQRELDLLMGTLKIFWCHPSFINGFFKGMKLPPLIIMSATIIKQDFLTYFEIPNTAIDLERVTLELRHEMTGIVRRTCLDRYLDDMQTDLDISLVDNFNYEGIFESGYIFSIYQTICNLQNDNRWRNKAILVFLPGVGEIEMFIGGYENFKDIINLLILPFHGKQTDQEQQLARDINHDPSVIKVVLTTNIAESSLTIPDINIIFNFCLTKIATLDAYSGYQTLDQVWATKDQNIQRQGRVGRVQDGLCYHLVPKQFFQVDNPQVPEMMRLELENVILLILKLDSSLPMRISKFLYTFIKNYMMSSPSDDRVYQAISNCLSVGAIIGQIDPIINKFINQAERMENLMLTWAGRFMSSIPIDHRLSRLILLGQNFGFVQDTIIIASARAISNQLVFKQSTSSLNSWICKENWSQNTCSDEIAIMNAYKGWRGIKKLQYKNQNVNTTNQDYNADKIRNIKQKPKTPASMDYLNINAFINMNKSYWDIYERLNKRGVDLKLGREIHDLTSQEQFEIKNENILLLKISLVGASSLKSLFVTKQNSTLGTDASNYSSHLNNTNNFISVFLEDVPNDFNLGMCGSYLQKQLTNPFGLIPKLTWEKKYNRLMASYTSQDSDPLLGSIHRGVVGIIKHFKMFASHHNLSMEFEANIPCSSPAAIDRFNKNKDILKQKSVWSSECYIVTHFLKPNTFYVIQEELNGLFNQIRKILNSVGPNLVSLNPTDIYYDKQCIVYNNQVHGFNVMEYSRGLIKSEIKITKSGVNVLVECVDTGITKWIEFDKLYEFTQGYLSRHHWTVLISTLPLAIQCYIPDIYPASTGCGWSWKSKAWSEHYIKDRPPKLGFGNKISLKIINHQENPKMIICQDVREFTNTTTNKLTFVNFLIQENLAIKTNLIPIKDIYHDYWDNSSDEGDSNDLEKINNSILSLQIEDEIFQPARIPEILQCRGIDFNFNPQDLCSTDDGKIKLNFPPPSNPLLTNIMTCLNKTNGFRLKIDSNSLNNLILDPMKFTQEWTKKMIVAGVVQVVGKKKMTLVLNATTMIPPIPGICDLLYLIFTPVIELIRNRDTLIGERLRLFQKTHTGHAKLVFEDACEIYLSDDMVVIINEIRAIINNIYMNGPNKRECKAFREKLLRLMNRHDYLVIKKDTKNLFDANLYLLKDLIECDITTFMGPVIVHYM